MPPDSRFGPRRLIRALMHLPAWAYMLIALAGLAAAMAIAIIRSE